MMKRRIASYLFATVLAAWGICASACAGAQPQDAGSGSCGNRNGCQPVRTLGGKPAGETVTPYFADIPETVVEAYGSTTLDMLSSGPFMLVKWPHGCCTKNGRWRTGGTHQNPSGNQQHVIVLWPAL